MHILSYLLIYLLTVPVVMCWLLGSVVVGESDVTVVA